MTATLIIAAGTRTQIADFVQALFYVYSILIIAYVLVQLFFGFGGRVPFSRPVSAVLDFLRDVCEPYLRIFRRFIPPLGPVDITPIVALLVLGLVGQIIVNLIAG